MLTFVREDSAAILGIFASDRGRGADAFQETGRIVDVRISGPVSLGFRVAMSNHANCVFDANLRVGEMGGSYSASVRDVVRAGTMDGAAQLLNGDLKSYRPPFARSGGQLLPRPVIPY